MKIKDITAYILTLSNKYGVRPTARMLDVSPSSICHWKSGESKPGVKAVQAMIDNGLIEIKTTGREDEIFKKK